MNLKETATFVIQRSRPDTAPHSSAQSLSSEDFAQFSNAVNAIRRTESEKDQALYSALLQIMQFSAEDGPVQIYPGALLKNLKTILNS